MFNLKILSLTSSFYILISLICISLLPLSSIEAAEAEKVKENKFNIRVELSYVSTSGNTDSQTLAGKVTADKKVSANKYFFSGNVLFEENNGAETSNRILLESRFERILSGRLFLLLSTSYIRDKFSGYKYRLYGGPGAGYNLLNTKKHKLQSLLSFVYSYDEFSVGNSISDNYLTGKATGKYQYIVKENFKFKETVNYLVSFDKTEKYFLDSETAVEVKINQSLSLGISYLVNYQNMLPSAEVKRTDTTFLTTLIFAF